MISGQTKEMLSHYYRHPDIRARLVEFLGGSDLETVTAEYITADDENANVQHRPTPTRELWTCLDNNFEVGRSLWDQESLIVDFDVEYVNFDHPAFPFVQSKLCYELQEPVVATVQRWLLKYGIAPLHWISGQGHHFAWKINQASDAFQQLTGFGQLTPSLQARYQAPSVPHGREVGLRLGSAFAGLGMVMQYVAEEIKRRCAGSTKTPIALTAIEAGPSRGTDMPQREVIALDISEYGDPLDTRGIRMPFSVYLKPSQKRFQLGDPFVDAMPPIFPIPLFEMETATALDLMHQPKRVIELAARASTSIPDFSNQMSELIASYKSSKLASFHRSYYADSMDFSRTWLNHEDPSWLEAFPSCVRQPLQQPNDLLLKPAVVQHLVRALMACDWTPRKIAALVQSVYEQDFDWGERWDRYDAAQRAEFYVRMFAGAIATGTDQLVDFNCVSTQEKRFCPVENCEQNLLQLRDRLLQLLSTRHGCDWQPKSVENPPETTGKIR